MWSAVDLCNGSAKVEGTPLKWSGLVQCRATKTWSPVALPGDGPDCACIISDPGAGQQKPAAQTEPLAVHQCALSL